MKYSLKSVPGLADVGVLPGVGDGPRTPPRCLYGKESFRSFMKISADMLVMMVMVKGKFKKFYEDFHRAKSLIAFLSQKTACPVYLFQASSSSPHKSNKTSVFQVMSTDPAAI